MSDSRARVWTFIVYPESVVANWISVISDFHVPFCVSPLHDSDINPTGEVKKPHFHVVIYFSGKKSFSQVRDITDSLNQPIPQVVNDIRSMVRYLVHYDNPEKHQYNRKDIKALNGFDLRNYFDYSKDEKYDMIADMLDFIDENGIKEIVTFSNYCRTVRRNDWWHLFLDYNRVFDIHIRSLRNGYDSIK